MLSMRKKASFLPKNGLILPKAEAGHARGGRKIEQVERNGLDSSNLHSPEEGEE